MAKLTRIQRYGNQMKVMFDDGTFVMADPANDDMWLGRNPPPPVVVPPDPPPTPPPSGSGARFQWPFIPKSYTQGGDMSGTSRAEYGRRDGKLHAGMDFGYGKARAGALNTAAADGKVTIAGTHGGYGLAVVLDHGNGLATLYGHNSSLRVRVGNTVKRGQAIGVLGNTGNSRGAHLHFETHTGGYRWYASSMNPRDFMAKYANG